MSRALAETLMRVAVRLMPRARRPWAEAMARELAEIDDRREAMRWAMGALISAAWARVLPMAVIGGRGVVALLTALYAAIYLAQAVNGAQILLGAPDWYHDKLLAWGHPEAAAARQARLPWITTWNTVMAVSHISAAVFLVRWRPRAFEAFAGAALAATLCITVPAAFAALRGQGGGFWWVGSGLVLMLIGAARAFDHLEGTHK